jgi:hypothetical protein
MAMCPEQVVAEIRELFDELAQLSAALVAWDGAIPPRPVIEEKIAAAEARVAEIERSLRG